MALHAAISVILNKKVIMGIRSVLMRIVLDGREDWDSLRRQFIEVLAEVSLG
jgi:hypothetical protein